ncbi:hypothetical protein LINPERHAP1_LOCUS34773, partial [Linum perenne]
KIPKCFQIPKHKYQLNIPPTFETRTLKQFELTETHNSDLKR